MRVLAVDLGGTHAACALVDNRKIVAHETVSLSSFDSLRAALHDITGPLHRLHSNKIGEAIGFGFCGLVDASHSQIVSTNGKYTDAIHLNLRDWAKSEFGLPLRLENDARLALLGECYAGAAQGETDVVMFTLGTGIGGAAMLDGQLLKGKHGQAGVLGGHLPINFRGRRCTCGGIGCAESEASGWALPQIARSWPRFASSSFASTNLDFEHLFLCAQSGDSVACEIVDHCLHAWGATAVAAIHAFDPDLLVFGGGVMKSKDVILPFIQSYVKKNAWTPCGTVRVSAAELGNQAALLGVVPMFEQESPFVR